VVVGRIFKDELKLDLEDLAHCSVNSMFEALAKVREWMDQARKRIIPPASNPPPVDAGPQEVKADPPPANEAARIDVAEIMAKAKWMFQQSKQRKP